MTIAISFWWGAVHSIKAPLCSAPKVRVLEVYSTVAEDYGQMGSNREAGIFKQDHVISSGMLCDIMWYHHRCRMISWILLPVYLRVNNVGINTLTTSCMCGVVCVCVVFVCVCVCLCACVCVCVCEREKGGKGDQRNIQWQSMRSTHCRDRSCSQRLLVARRPMLWFWQCPRLRLPGDHSQPRPCTPTAWGYRVNHGTSTHYTWSPPHPTWLRSTYFTWLMERTISRKL